MIATECSALSIAPMIDWTYSHFRVFMRMLAPQALLYTEMQTTGAIANNPRRSLFFNAMEHPIALQLGGSDKVALAEASKKAEQAGYDEVNLNLGCPSDKVQAGHFGACLMKEPDRVFDCIQAMQQAVKIPITAKTRIGIDNEDSYDFFSAFAQKLVDAGSKKLIVHARKAWLNGLSPKQNRTIPPINYDYVYQIKSQFPDLPVVINGSITELSAITTHLTKLDGVMLGRLACDNPYKLVAIHHLLYPSENVPTRQALFERYVDYVLKEYATGVSLSLLIKPVFNLAFGLAGASLWKQQLMTLIQSKNLRLVEDLKQYLRAIET